MRTIFKYTIPEPDKRTFISRVSMPQGANILTVASQAWDMQVWAEVESTNPMVTRLFRVVGTGWNLDEISQGYDHPQLGRYITTVIFQDRNPRLVFHVFDLGTER